MTKKLNYLCIIVLINILFFSSCNSSNTEKISERITVESNQDNYENISIESTMESRTIINSYDSAVTKYPRKQIKIGNMNMLIEDMDIFSQDLQGIVDVNEGYFENYDLYYGNENYKYKHRELHATIRIPKEQYQLVKDEIAALGNIISFEDSIEDVSEEYYDIESRLESKRVQEKRLLELINNANNIQEILEIEKRLGEVRTEIELFEMNLNSIDSKVAYSTLYIDATESKEHLNNTLDMNPGLAKRMKKSLIFSWNKTISVIQNIIVGITYVIVPLLLVSAILAICYYIYKLFVSKKKKDNIE